MAGVKGRSGGARPGAGRKPKVVENAPKPIGERDMLQLLQDVALGRVEATALQVRAAIAAVQYTHLKTHDGGRKDDVEKRAKKAASKFAPSAPPKLVAVGGKRG